MAIIDNLQKISDAVWELPSTYKDAVRSNRGRDFDDGACLRASAGPDHGKLQTALEPGAAISEAVRRPYVPVIAWGTFSVCFDASGKATEAKVVKSTGYDSLDEADLEKPTGPGVYYSGAYQI